ncbi:MAG: alcohol dehydrogenase [Desulfuromonas sp.]|nr:MAG: alcohol dehydrogenase [Desulfuromonas sp.]
MSTHRYSSTTDLRKFVAPEYIFGAGARHLVGEYARKLGARRILLVSDPGVMAAGWCAEVEAALEHANLPYHLFSMVTPNPRDAEVMAGVEAFVSGGCNAIVAVGGGSPMDCAKGIGIVAANGGHILDYEGVDRVPQPIPPLICIPTTGGSSADVSQFSIISAVARQTKIAIVSKTVVPDLALIDPETLMSMSPYLTACTGLDALTHAIEAFVSNAQSAMTDLHALEAIRLLGRSLLPAIRDPEAMLPRLQVMQASLHAGLAFSNAILGAVHAMAHSLGGRFDLAHGECNAILLDHVVAYNLPAARERFAAVAEALGLALAGLERREQEAQLLTGLRWLKQEVGITRTLGDLGVTSADVSELSDNAFRDPCLLTNPRPTGRDDLATLYGEAL